MGGVPLGLSAAADIPVYGDVIGYVHQVDIAGMQSVAEAEGVRLRLAALPGTFAAPGRALVFVVDGAERLYEAGADELRAAFTTGRDRTFEEGPVLRWRQRIDEREAPPNPFELFVPLCHPLG